MKKIAFLFLLLLMAVSCSKSEPEENGGNGQNKPEEKVESIEIPSTVDTTPTITESADTVNVAFTASATWTASIINTRADSWCSVYPTSGAAGKADINISCKENTTPDERSATIVIKCGTTTKNITITQKQKDALTITESSIEVEAEGGEISVEVKANVSFKYSISSEVSGWIKYISTKALKTSKLVFDVSANTDLDSRQGEIYVTNGTLTDTITIYQQGSNPFVVLGSNSITIESDGGIFDVEVTHNVDAALEAIFPNGVIPWFSSVETRAASTNKYSFVAKENSTYSSRSAMIIAHNRDAEIADTVYVTQKQNNAIIIGNDKYYLPCEGGEFEIKIQSNIEATAETIFPENVTPWLSEVNTKALSDSTFKFVAQENISIEPRSAKIVFKNSENNLSDTVNVFQYQKGLVAGDKEYTVEMQGGNFSIDLIEKASVQIKYEDANTGGWIDASVTDKQCIVNVAKNDSYSSRSAILLFNNADNSNKDTVNITQLQTNAIIIGNTRYYIKSAGGDFTVRIQSNVTATAQPVFPENVDPWFRATETKSLSESLFTFTADENISSEPRTAIILFSNAESNLTDTVTVTQYNKGLILGEKVLNLGPDAYEYNITFTENVDYWEDDLQIEGWPHINGMKVEITGNRGLIKIGKNTTFNKRACALIFSSLDHKITDTLKIYQRQNDSLWLETKDTLRIIDSRAQTMTVMVNTNVDMTASVRCESGNWIKPIETKGLGARQFEFTVDENKEDTQRKAYITYTSKDSTLSQTMTVVQKIPYKIEKIFNADTVYFFWNQTENEGFSGQDVRVRCEVPVSYGMNENRFRVEKVEKEEDDNSGYYDFVVYAKSINNGLEPYIEELHLYNYPFKLEDTVTLIQHGKNQLSVELDFDNSYDKIKTYSDDEQQIKVPITRNTEFDYSIISGNEWLTEGNHIIHDLNVNYGNVCYDTLVFNLPKNRQFERNAEIKIEYKNSDFGISDYIFTIVQQGTDDEISVEVNGTEIITSGISINELRKCLNVKISGSMSGEEFCLFFAPDKNSKWSAKILNLHYLDITDDMIYDTSNDNTKVVIEGFHPNFPACFQQLEQLYLPQSVKVINWSAFNNLRKLKILEFGENSEVEEIRGSGGYNSVGQATLNGAFQNCTELERVVLPAKLKGLWGGAFNNCTKLKEISFEKCTEMQIIKAWAGVSGGNTGFWSPNNPSGQIGELGMFVGIPNITSFTVPECVITIGDRAFYGSSIKEITIGDHVQTISPKAFEGCKLSRINSSKFSPDGVSIVYNGRLIYVSKEVEEYRVPESVTRLNPNVFDGGAFKTIILNDNITELPDEIFANCIYLEEVVLPANLKEIPYRCFYNRNKLKNLTVPANVEIIGTEAYSGSSLSGDIILGNNITTIGSGAFSNTNITSIIIPENCSSIESSIVSYCKKLKSVKLPSQCNVNEDSFDTNYWFDGCTSLETVNLPEGITKIGGSMFSGCNSLNELIIPESVKYIGYAAFRNCTALKEIIIPDKVVTLDEYSFSGCTSIEEIVVPDNVTDIGKEAFSGCVSLKNIILNEGLVQISLNAFSGCGLSTIIFPSTIQILSLGEYYMSSVKTIYIKAINPPSLSTNSFPYPDYMPIIYVPTSSLELYKSKWPALDSQLQGYDF